MILNLLVKGKWIGLVLSGGVLERIVWMILTMILTERNIRLFTLSMLVCSSIRKPGSCIGMFRRLELVMNLTLPAVGRRVSLGMIKPVQVAHVVMRRWRTVGVPRAVSSVKS